MKFHLRMGRSPLLGLLMLASPALPAPVSAPHSRAELIAEHAHARPGHPITVALRLELEDQWHTYWKNPGDSGMPTSIAWTLPPGFTAGPLQWPAPSRIETPPLVSYGYAREAWLLTDIHVPSSPLAGRVVPIAARADWLVCKEICIPASANLNLAIPVSAQLPSRNADWADAFARARTRIPVALSGWRASADRDGDQFVLRLRREGGSAPQLRALSFFPEREGVVDNVRAQQLRHSAAGYELRIATAPQAIGHIGGLAGVLVAEPGLGETRVVEIDVPLRQGAPAAVLSAGLAAAVVLAFLGGLILNLMPCVFPVLAIKALSVIQRAHGDPGKLRTHGLLFGVGVLVSFWAVAGLLLALRARGAAVGWGYHLQSPPVVALLAILFFVLALNLSGVFQLGARLQSLAGGVQLRNDHADAFASGLLATVVASPCTAPLMGAALGFALVQPAWTAMLVFSALALGMAAPLMLLCFTPQLIGRLPRPGPWMETLKQFLAFPLYATVVWLTWVLGQQLGIDAAAKLLAGLTAIAAALWMLGLRGTSAGGTIAQGTAGALAVAGVALAWPYGNPAAESAPQAGEPWQRWSEAAVTQALAQDRPVFVDFTAAWCVTCQVNKRLVLHSERVARRFDEMKVARLRADWTNRDPAITAALQDLNRSGVPVYALYVPRRREPVLLPEILTHAIVLDALDQAAAAPRASLSLSNPRQETP